MRIHSSLDLMRSSPHASHASESADAVYGGVRKPSSQGCQVVFSSRLALERLYIEMFPLIGFNRVLSTNIACRALCEGPNMGLTYRTSLFNAISCGPFIGLVGLL